jgi:hypothetical protein
MSTTSEEDKKRFLDQSSNSVKRVAKEDKEVKDNAVDQSGLDLLSQVISEDVEYDKILNSQKANISNITKTTNGSSSSSSLKEGKTEKDLNWLKPTGKREVNIGSDYQAVI